MTVRVRARLTGITEWSRCQWKIDGDVSREGESPVLGVLADEVKEKLEDCTFKPPGLPFEREFDMVPDGEDEVKCRLLDEYVTEFMEHDYVVPTDCEFEYEILKEQE